MNTRVNVIMNGRQELAKVLGNLKKLFDGDDTVILYTKSDFSEFKNTIQKVFSIDDKEFSENVSFDKFNEIDYDSIKKNGAKKIVGIKMPNMLFHSIAKAYNDAFQFVDKTEIAKFIHVFADDCKIISDSYDPTVYEEFMDTFGEKFIMDSKLNQGNYAFKKFSPRFVFMSQKNLKQPISFVQFESKDHFIINRSEFKQNFDGKLKRMYIPEFVIRAHKNGVVKHTSFYPDPVLEAWVKRDNELPYTEDIKSLSEEYSADEKYIKNELKESIGIENSVDPIINELTKIIREKFEKCSEE